MESRAIFGTNTNFQIPAFGLYPGYGATYCRL